MPLRFTLTCALVAILSAPVAAAPVAYEPFTGANGAPLNGSSGGSGWSSNWTAGATDVTVAFANKSMSYVGGNVSILGGTSAMRINTAGGIGGAIPLVGNRGFTNQTGSVWVSFLFETPTGGGTNNDFFQLGPDNSVTNPRASVGVAATTGATAGPAQFFDRLSIATTPTTTSFTTDGVVNNETYFLVALIEKISPSSNYNRISLFVNPTDADNPGTPVAVVNTSSGIPNLNQLIFRLARLDAGDTYFVDELRIGTTYADVVVRAPDPIVPAPATLGVFAVLAGVAALRKHRRMAHSNARS